MELFLNFMLYIVAAIGLSHLLADATIFNPLKTWLSELKPEGNCFYRFRFWLGQKTLSMMNCYQCNGFWSGVLIYLMYLSAPYTNFLLWGFAISLLSPIVGFAKLYLNLLTYPEDSSNDDR